MRSCSSTTNRSSSTSTKYIISDNTQHFHYTYECFNNFGKTLPSVPGDFLFSTTKLGYCVASCHHWHGRLARCCVSWDLGIASTGWWNGMYLKIAPVPKATHSSSRLILVKHSNSQDYDICVNCSYTNCLETFVDRICNMQEDSGISFFLKTWAW